MLSTRLNNVLLESLLIALPHPKFGHPILIFNVEFRNVYHTSQGYCHFPSSVFRLLKHQSECLNDPFIHRSVNLVQGVCHLFSSVEVYCKQAHSSSAQFEASNSNLESLTQYDHMDMENYVMDKASEEIELSRNASASVPFHLHTPEALFKVTEGIPHGTHSFCLKENIEFLRISVAYKC